MHVAHDVCVGSGCIIGNSTKIAGEVVVDDFAIISANVLVHQFCHIGSYVMVGGGTRTGQDIPPFSPWRHANQWPIAVSTWLACAVAASRPN